MATPRADIFRLRDPITVVAYKTTISRRLLRSLSLCQGKQLSVVIFTRFGCINIDFVEGTPTMFLVSKENKCSVTITNLNKLRLNTSQLSRKPA